MFDTLHGADRIVGVDVRGIGSRTLDEQVGHLCAGLVPAQDFESPQTCQQPRRIIVAV